MSTTNSSGSGSGSSRWLAPAARTRAYLHHNIKGLPSAYSSLDTNRLTLLHFLVHSLKITRDKDLFGPSSECKQRRQRIIDWILNLKVVNVYAGDVSTTGFCGGTFHGRPFSPSLQPDHLSVSVSSHIAMTYCALLTLLELGYDIGKLDAEGIMRGVGKMQNLDAEKDGVLYGR